MSSNHKMGILITLGILGAALLLLFIPSGEDPLIEPVTPKEQRPGTGLLVNPELPQRKEQKTIGLLKSNSSTGELPGGERWKYEKLTASREKVTVSDPDGVRKTYQISTGHRGATLRIETPYQLVAQKAQNLVRLLLNDDDLLIVESRDKSSHFLIAKNILATSVQLEARAITLNGLFPRNYCKKELISESIELEEGCKRLAALSGD